MGALDRQPHPAPNTANVAPTPRRTKAQLHTSDRRVCVYLCALLRTLGFAVFAQLLLQRSFGRYPAAARQNSSNYNPIPPWSLGIQMVRVFHGGSHLQALRAFDVAGCLDGILRHFQYSQWGRRAASTYPQIVAPLSGLHDVPRVRSARAAYAICVKPSRTEVLSQSARPPARPSSRLVARGTVRHRSR